jgi:hypothetical protein
MKDQDETEASRGREPRSRDSEENRKTRLEWAKVAASMIDAVARLADLSTRFIR